MTQKMSGKEEKEDEEGKEKEEEEEEEAKKMFLSAILLCFAKSPQLHLPVQISSFTQIC